MRMIRVKNSPLFIREDGLVWSSVIVDFPLSANSFELDYSISGTSGVSIPYYILEKLENTEEITTEWA